MSVKIITGSIGSGKTRYCIDEIAKAHKSDADRRCIMLVPSHYSHETERMLINEFGGTGLNNIECTTFEKLARELLGTTQNRLGASGKNALVCRAITLALKGIEKNELNIDRRIIKAVTKRGFIDVAASLISELHRYNITPEKVNEQSDTEENPLLSEKLKVLALVAKEYEALLENADYVDSDKDLSRLAGVIGDNFTSADRIWIDKFDELLPQQFDVIRALIDSGAEITITFNVCGDDTYYGTQTAIAEISDYTKAEQIHLTGAMEHINAPDLKFLFSTWFGRETYPDHCENVEIFMARDAYTETEHAARKILDLVREDKHRFCDIGIVCAREEDYSHIIEAVFDEYEIPYYTDSTIAISEYPIAMQLLALFDVVEHNWSYEAMFEYLRAGFIYMKARTRDGRVKYKRLNPDDIDLIENHVLKYGLDYKSAWCRSWLDKNAGVLDTAFETDPESFGVTESLDGLRQEIVAPVLKYSEAVKEAETVSDYCCALFAFLEDINLYQGLKNELLVMAMNDATADGQRFGQIWNLILGVLDEVNTALGDEKATHEEFCEFIRAAMNQCQIRTVPSGIDRVFVGTADMNRAIPTPIMFVMGAVSGTFPNTNLQEGFFSDADRESLLKKEFRLAPTTKKKTEKVTNTVYKLLSAVKDKLYISYPTITADGGANLPSQLVADIAGKLPDIRVYDDVMPEEGVLYVSSPKATMHRFLINPSRNPLWTHVDKWFADHNEWRNRLFRVKHAKNQFSRRSIELNPELAQELYEGKTRYSATRLNAYANCPFGHFMQYGLAIRERDEYEIKAKDTGSYAHEIIRRFCARVDEDTTLSWKDIDDAKCTELVSEIVSDTIEKINSSDLRDKEMTADILDRMGKTVAEAAKTVSKSIKCGEFETEAYEKEVSVKLTQNIELGGIIDRLDVCRHDGKNEYRIIDYKTGNKEFSATDVYNGYDMQPVIYALVMRMLDDKATISGMYYSMVHNDFAQADITSGEKKIKTELRKNTAYNGVTFVGDDRNTPIPTDEMNRVESELSRNEGALFLKGKTDEFGYGKYTRPRPEGEWLMEKVRDNIIEADKAIREGNIEISPLVRGSNIACTYCAYQDVCKFDEALKTERAITEKDSEVWDILGEER